MPALASHIPHPTSNVTPVKTRSRKLHLELGTGGLAWQERAFAPYQLQPRGETARQASALAAVVGGQAQAALVLPVWKGFSLRPMLSLSALSQQATVQSSLGPNVPIALAYNADSSQISGAPTIAPTTQTERRVLLLPTAGLSLLWQWGPLGLMAGGQYAAAFSVAESAGAAGQKPATQPIGYHFGLRYSLTPHLLLQAEARRLSLTQNALPGITGSHSEGWLLGLGVFWGW